MSGTKRVGVPPVQRPKPPADPLTPEKNTPKPKPAAEADLTLIPVVPEADAPRTIFTALNETYSLTERITVNIIQKTANVIAQNSPAIKQKAVVFAGALAGMLITSVLVDRLGDRRPNVIVINEPGAVTDGTDNDPDATVQE